MAGWPSFERVEDRRLAQSLRGDDDHALVEIYDLYAPRLYDYCHALLRDKDLAADALHDSLIATQEHIAKLREPERFRGWVYTIVRNECLRVLSDPDRPDFRHESAEETDDAFLDPEERRQREDTRQLVHSALAGLAPRHREAIDLAARHDLSPEELAGPLGISSQHATELVAEAREGLDRSLAAAIIARTGREDCPSVAALVDEQSWPLQPDVARKLVRHIESCPTCRERRKRKVSTTRLMQVLPVAAIPSELRGRVLDLAEAPDRHEARTIIAQRAEPFDVWGWPTSVDRARPARGASHVEEGSRSPRMWPAVGAAACVILLVGALFLVFGGGGGSKPAADDPSGGVAAGSSSEPSDIPSPTDTAGLDSPTPSLTPTKKKHTPTPTPTTTRPRPMPRPTQPTPTPKPTPGTLTVAGCKIATSTGTTCSITLTAHGGAVSWKVSDTNGVSVSHKSGTIKRGGTTMLTVTRDVPCSDIGAGSVTFSPGGTAHITWSCPILGGG